MINLVEVTNNQGSVLGLSLDQVESGLVLGEVEGLEPVKATIVSSSFAQQDGVQYQSSRRDQRDIKLNIDLEPDYAVDTVRSLRKQLYRFLMPKSAVKLRFHDDDGLVVDIEGRVESFDAPLFTDEPNASINIICFNPDFVETTSEEVPGNTVSTGTEFTIDYEGTVETGIIFTLNVNRAMPAFSIYHRWPDGTLRQLDWTYPLVNGNELIISTIPGEKSAKIAGTSVLYGITPQSNWIELQPGVNTFRVYSEGAAVPFTIEYTNKYGGL